MLETFLILGSIYFLVKIIETLKFMFTKQENSSLLGLMAVLMPFFLNIAKPQYEEILKEIKNKHQVQELFKGE